MRRLRATEAMTHFGPSGQILCRRITSVCRGAAETQKKCAGRHRRDHALPPSIDCPSRESPGMHRYASRVGTPTGCVREEVQGPPSQRTCEGRVACEWVELSGRLPRPSHMDQDEFPTGNKHSDGRALDGPGICTPRNAKSEGGTPGGLIHSACKSPVDSHARRQLRPG